MHLVFGLNWVNQGDGTEDAWAPNGYGNGWLRNFGVSIKMYCGNLNEWTEGNVQDDNLHDSFFTSIDCHIYLIRFLCTNIMKQMEALVERHLISENKGVSRMV